MKTNFLKLFLCFSLCGLFMTIRAGEAEKKWAFDNLRRYSGIESFESRVRKAWRGGNIQGTLFSNGLSQAQYDT